MRWVAINFILFGMIAGCMVAGCNSKPPEADPNVARTVLTSSLDAWKADRAIASLQQQQPPIFVIEDRWQDGIPLLDYVVSERQEMLGSSIRFDVELIFQSRREKARFMVTTEPALTVARLD